MVDHPPRVAIDRTAERVLLVWPDGRRAVYCLPGLAAWLGTGPLERAFGPSASTRVLYLYRAADGRGYALDLDRPPLAERGRVCTVGWSRWWVGE